MKLGIVTKVSRYAVLHTSVSRLDGERSHFEFRDCVPLLFAHRKDAAAWIKERHGYLWGTGHQYLRREPFGWRYPKVVKVSVSISQEGHSQ